MTPDTLISVGRIVKSRGLLGEVVVFPLTDDPERFKSFGEVIATTADGSESILTVTSSRTHRRHGRIEIHLQLDGISSREQADGLRGVLLSVPRSGLALDEGEYFLFDLEGIEVTTPSGEVLGHVRDVRRLPGQDLIVVSLADGRESLIPDVPEFVDKSQIGEGRLVVTPIEGLLTDLTE